MLKSLQFGIINGKETPTGERRFEAESTDSETTRNFPLPFDSERRRALLRQTIATWQPLSERELTLEDAREIVENLTGYFGVLLRWQDRRDKEKWGRADATSRPRDPDQRRVET